MVEISYFTAIKFLMGISDSWEIGLVVQPLLRPGTVILTQGIKTPLLRRCSAVEMEGCQTVSLSA